MSEHETYIEISKDALVLVLIASFAIPIFKSGGKRGLNFWEWLLNHTIWAPKGLEYIPEEDYKAAFRQKRFSH